MRIQMDFASFGDADGYRMLGQSCADFIVQREGMVGSCYHAIRPVGILVYSSIPFLLSKDPLEQNYIAVLMNLIFLMLLITSLVVAFKNLSGSGPDENRWASYLGGTAIVTLTLILCVAYIPVRLSDIQSLACFTASTAILSSESNRRHWGALLVAGVMAGFSVLLKQNYVVSIFFLAFFWCCLDFRAHLESRLKYVLLYLIGASFCLVQVAAVYYHSGEPWFYESAAMAGFAPSNHQPYVELVAYTDPIQTAYLSKLQGEVSPFQFVAVRFYEGMMKFYLAVYSGRAPLDITPEILVFSAAKLLCMQLLMAVMAVATLLTALFKNKWIAVISYTATASIFLSTTILHTENRYFLTVKVYLVLVLAVVFVRFVNKYFKSKRPMPPSKPT